MDIIDDFSGKQIPNLHALQLWFFVNNWYGLQHPHTLDIYKAFEEIPISNFETNLKAVECIGDGPPS